MILHHVALVVLVVLAAVASRPLPQGLVLEFNVVVEQELYG